MTTLYKFLNEGGETPIGNGSWFLPHGKRPGKWMPKIKGDLVACENGYHLAREQDLLEWCNHPELYVAEYRGEEIVDAGNKVVVREARLLSRVTTWNERTARLFACDCAERALAVIAKHEAVDPRSTEAVKVARLYAIGEATKEQLTAARDAAWAAARDADWAAARDADWDAAWAAAWDAAWAAAWAAARAAAWAAAWDAARDADWAADWAAAWAAARDAAWAAEKKWQTERLLKYLSGDLK